MRTVLIKNETGLWTDAKVIDCETGLEIPNIQCAEIKIKVGEVNTARITMIGIATEIQAETYYDIKCPHCMRKYKSYISEEEIKGETNE